MYNRYIGNTGKFYRVEDVDAVPAAPPPSEPDRGVVLRTMEEVRQWETAQSRNQARQEDEPRQRIDIPREFHQESPNYPQQQPEFRHAPPDYPPQQPEFRHAPPDYPPQQPEFDENQPRERFQTAPPPPPPPPGPEESASKFDLGKMFQLPGSLRQTVRDWLPAGLDLGDILLILVLLYLFLEGEDDDMLIILGILLFTWIRPLFQKGEEPL